MRSAQHSGMIIFGVNIGQFGSYPRPAFPTGSTHKSMGVPSPKWRTCVQRVSGELTCGSQGSGLTVDKGIVA